MNLPIAPQDKANHFLYGQGIWAATYSVCFFLVGMPAEAAQIGAIGTVALLAFLKELADYESNLQAKEQGTPPMHEVSLWDMLATIAGGLFTWFIFALR